MLGCVNIEIAAIEVAAGEYLWAKMNNFSRKIVLKIMQL